MNSNSSKSRPYVNSGTWMAALALCGLLACHSPATGQEKRPASESQSGAVQMPTDVAQRKLRTSWQKLSDREANEITRRHLHGLVRAAHRYHEQHGTFPPAVVPNNDLPAGKRLSGLVLLLPHLDADSWIDAGEPCFDAQTVDQAKQLYNRIDLNKAWDDPVNLEAARTIVPAFVSPTFGPLRTDQGFAVTHFAFIQGSADGLDGAFPGDTSFKLSDIKDGTSNTLAMGQVIDDLGPWIAEGHSTARQLHPPTNGEPGTFGSRYQSGAYFALCDSATFFIVFDKVPDEAFKAAATRDGSDFSTIDVERAIITNPVQLRK